MEKWIICDKDGTLANCSWRAPLIPDWDAFHAVAVEDKPYPEVVELINCLSLYHPVLILTGTPIRHKGATQVWLNKHSVEHTDISMRPDTDYSSDPECKWKQAVTFFGSEEAVRERVLCVFDDREKVVEMWRNKGLVCLQPRLGDY